MDIQGRPFLSTERYSTGAPALRDRGDDIIVIAQSLLAKYATEYGQSIKGFTGKALTSMQQYTWPGNVRQLENKIKRAVVLCDGSKPL